MKQALIYALLYTSALLSMQSNESLNSPESVPELHIIQNQSESHPRTQPKGNKSTTPSQATKQHTDAPQQSAQATLLLGAWAGLLHGPEFGYYD